MGSTEIIVAAITFIGVLTNIVVNSWYTRRNLDEARKTERYKYLISLMTQLQEAYEEYEQFLAGENIGTRNELKHAQIIGKAIAACFAASDICEKQGKNSGFDCLKIQANEQGFDECAEKCQNRLIYIAKMRLTRNFVEESDDNTSNPAIGLQQKAEIEKWGNYQNRNRNALNDAIIRLAELIAELK